MMFFKQFKFYAVLLTLSLILLWGVGAMERTLDRTIAESHLRYSGSVKGASPLVAFTTVALGSFRGLVADMLWLRSIKVQEKGDYFELVQLAQWMTDLQPEFAEATAYLAWNMAYNLSTTCSYPEDRWRWIHEGIKLLRDRAIKYDPENVVLYQMLGWIYQHKFGHQLDSSQKYYKIQLAKDMMRVLAPDTDLAALTAAPVDQEAFLAAYPANSPLGRALTKAGVADIEELYRQFKSQDIELSANQTEVDAIYVAALPDKIKERLNDPAQVKILDDYLRARYLRDRYKMEPGKMLSLDQKYGKLDWRLPEAHAIYWATLGLEKAPDHKGAYLERIISQSLADACYSGNLKLIDPKSFKYFHLVPNYDLMEAALASYDLGNELYDKRSFRDGKRTFAQILLALSYSGGRYKQAQRLYDEIKKVDKSFNRKMTYDTLENYAIKQWLDMAEICPLKEIIGLINNFLVSSFMYQLLDDPDAAHYNELIARRLYSHYLAKNPNDERLSLPPFRKMKEVAYQEVRTMSDDIARKLDAAGLGDIGDGDVPSSPASDGSIGTEELSPEFFKTPGSL